MRRIVESVIRQNQPPTLRMLALRLGYKDKKVLTGYFAGLCAELLAAAGPLRKRQIARLRRALQSYMRIEPAPSMAEVCRKAEFAAPNGQSKVPC